MSSEATTKFVVIASNSCLSVIPGGTSNASFAYKEREKIEPVLLFM